MKRFGIKVIIDILLIVCFTTGSLLLYQEQLIFSAFACVLLLIVAIIHLYRMQFKQITLLRRLTEGLRYNDMMQTIHPHYKSKMMNEWAGELSDSLKDFRKRLLAEEVKHQYYETLLNKVDTAVLVADKSGLIEWMNQSATSLFGQIARLPEPILKAAQSAGSPIIRLRHSNSLLEMAISSISFSTQGKEQLLISLKNIHSALEKNEMEAWQKLIRVLTHEMMNSITPIISLSETLSERGISAKPEEKEYAIMLQAMQTIHRRSKGLLEFVDNYRRLTRIPTPVRTLFSVNELLADIRKLFPAKEIHLELPEKDFTIRADRSQLEQILINLLKNGIESCSKKVDGFISVHAATIHNGCTLTVSDNGEGILPDVIDKIFVPFFTTKTNGSGIGLSLCKQIMVLHEGSITVSSEVGKGSSFTLYFPT